MGPRTGISKWSQGAAGRQSKALQSQKREGFDTALQEQCFVIFALEAGGKTVKVEWKKEADKQIISRKIVM